MQMLACEHHQHQKCGSFVYLMYVRRTDAGRHDEPLRCLCTAAIKPTSRTMPHCSTKGVPGQIVEAVLRELLVQVTHVLGETVQDPADGLGIKELHGALHNGQERLVVEAFGGVQRETHIHGRPQEGHHDGGGDQRGVDLEVVVASGPRLVFQCRPVCEPDVGVPACSKTSAVAVEGTFLGLVSA